MSGHPRQRRSTGPFRIFVRSRCSGRLRHAVGAVLIFQLAIGDQLVVLPFGGDRAAAQVSRIMGALWATILGPMVTRPSPELEWFPSRRLRRLRASWGATLIGAVSIGLECISQIRTIDAVGLQIRNGLFFAGLALLASSVLGARLVWVPTVLAGAILFTLGHRFDDGRPQRWAFTNVPSTMTWTWWVAIATAIAGLTAYTVFDSRAVREARTDLIA
ncbi:MAG: hypothetical protein RJB65_2428 [Actinomycetota bacterium]